MMSSLPIGSLSAYCKQRIDRQTRDANGQSCKAGPAMTGEHVLNASPPCLYVVVKHTTNTESAATLAENGYRRLPIPNLRSRRQLPPRRFCFCQPTMLITLSANSSSLALVENSAC